MAREPVVNLRAFANRNFAVGSPSASWSASGFNGLTYLYPLYLARVAGYSP